MLAVYYSRRGESLQVRGTRAEQENLEIRLERRAWRRARDIADSNKRLCKRCRLASVPSVSGSSRCSQTYFAKCFCFAPASFLVQGDCIWSVGEIVGLLRVSIMSVCYHRAVDRGLSGWNVRDSLCFSKLFGEQCLLTKASSGLSRDSWVGGLTGDNSRIH